MHGKIRPLRFQCRHYQRSLECTKHPPPSLSQRARALLCLLVRLQRSRPHRPQTLLRRLEAIWSPEKVRWQLQSPNLPQLCLLHHHQHPMPLILGTHRYHLHHPPPYLNRDHIVLPFSCVLYRTPRRVPLANPPQRHLNLVPMSRHLLPQLQYQRLRRCQKLLPNNLPIAPSPRLLPKVDHLVLLPPLTCPMHLFLAQMKQRVPM